MNALIKIIAIILMGQLVLAQHQGTECTSGSCTAKRGYFSYERGTLFINWRILSSQPTIFVVIIKNIETVTEEAWGTILPIYQYGSPSTLKQLNKENRIFIFNNTREVQIAVRTTNVLRFQVEYYAGCEVLEERNNSISKVPVPTATVPPPTLSPLCISFLQTLQFQYFTYLQQQRQSFQINAASPIVFNNWLFRQTFYVQTQYRLCLAQQVPTPKPTGPTCWVAIPTITEEINPYPGQAPERTFVEVQETKLALQNVTTNENSTVTVIDLLTGNTTISLETNQTFSISSLPKNNSTYLYENAVGQQTPIYTLLLVDLTCQNAADCNQAEFSFFSYAMRQSDVDCIERHNKCEFNLGSGNYTCNSTASLFFSFLNASSIIPLATEDSFTYDECEASRIFNEATIDALNAIDPDYVDGSRAGGKKQLQECPDYTQFCSTSCWSYKTKGCKRMCFRLVVHANACEHKHNIFP